MENKITLLGLCRAYSKIEIPILQRNYAQGHSKRVREPFVTHLVDTLEKGRTLELDFIYGGERKGEQGDASKVLIPLDGQQRLTTLWLLYWYLAVKDNRLDGELRRELSRFVYETRPMALDFCRYMLRITEGFEDAEAERIELLSKPEAYITNCYWYDLAWAQDATVSGMLKMLTEFARHYKTLQAIPFERLEQCIGFYHLPLSDFGLTNDLYIRMNARGAQLTDFEHFKSELYKLIGKHPRLEEVKTKMETTWVENLWAYKPKEADVVDEPFMGLLRFATYVNDVIKQRREGKTFERTQEPTSIAYLSSIYSNSDSVERLIDMLEVLPLLSGIDLSKGRFRDESLGRLIDKIFEGEDIGINGSALVYALMQYLRVRQTAEGIEPYLQVVRNLSANTSYAARELGQAFSAIDELAKQSDVYEYLAGGGEVPYFTTQLKEERWKARYIKLYPDALKLIHEVEGNAYLQGRIATLLAVAGGKERLEELSPEELQSERLNALYRGYKECARDDFKTIWGDLLNSELYSHRTWNDRVVYDKDYATNYDLVRFAMGYAESGLSLGDYCQEVERQEVLRLFDVYERYPEHSRNPKEQLYLYYVITRRVMRKGEIDGFFARGYNFGLLGKKQEHGYCSLFTRGIEGSHWFEKHNPIYQIYKTQFRYNEGLKKRYALLPELADECPTDVWAKLLDWAKS